MSKESKAAAAAAEPSILAEKTVARVVDADHLVDAWLIDHFGSATPQFLHPAAKDDLKSRVRTALNKE